VFRAVQFASANDRVVLVANNDSATPRRAVPIQRSPTRSRA